VRSTFRPISSAMRFSSTVLPTPRSPISICFFYDHPCLTRRKASSAASSSNAERPASSGGREPAPGAKGLRSGSKD
jgi:hypothetical protein